MKPYNESKKVEVKSIKNGEVILHGDVIIKRTELPEGFYGMREVRDGYLALGEATGHHHALIGEYDLREDDKKVKHLRLVEPCSIKHQEHHEIVLPPGDYTIGIQREYDHFEKITREVLD